MRNLIQLASPTIFFTSSVRSLRMSTNGVKVRPDGPGGCSIDMPIDTLNWQVKSSCGGLTETNATSVPVCIGPW
jgi:hypothetical protein